VWADLVVAPESPEFARTVASVESNPSAAVTMAMLIRHSEHRSIAQGLVAESAAYGLLQSGPEFATWRSARAARDRRSSTETPVLVARHGDELSIVLNRPDTLNALNTGMRDGLDNALQIAMSDPSVTSVRLTGSGSSFCNGGDLDEFGSRPDPVTAHLVRLQRSLGRSLAAVADRTTVRIHGRTSGSGIELAAFANLVVADPSTVISLPELQLGLIPGAGGTVSLPRRIGRHATMLLALGVPILALHFYKGRIRKMPVPMLLFWEQIIVEEERQYPDFQRATAWERSNLDRLLGG